MSQAGTRVLVLAPHPDDETFGCGGMIKQITLAGGEVDVLFMTRGENGWELAGPVSQAERQSLSDCRIEEARRACAILGVSNALFLDGHDARLAHQPGLWRDVLKALQQGGYRSVFCPWPGDMHVDHKATFDLLRSALRAYQRDVQIWLYEVWMPLAPNMVIPIDKTIDAKIAAMQAHASQLRGRDYVAAFTALAQYRALLQPPGRYAEAFYTCDRRQLLDDVDLPWSARGQSELEAAEA